MSAVRKRFEVKLDLKRTQSNREFEVVEGDTGNVIEIILTDDGEPVDLTSCRVMAVFDKADGTASQDSGSEGGGVSIGGADGNVITMELFTGSFAPGLVTCELQIYSGTGTTTLVTSARFNFACRRSSLNADTITATNEYPLLAALMNDVNGAIARMEGRAAHAASHKASGSDPISYRGSATLAAAGWVGSGPYTQEAAAPGLTAADCPTVDVVWSDSAETELAQIEAWALISNRIAVSEDKLTFYCAEDKPDIDIPIRYKGVR